MTGRHVPVPDLLFLFAPELRGQIRFLPIFVIATPRRQSWMLSIPGELPPSSLRGCSLRCDHETAQYQPDLYRKIGFQQAPVDNGYQPVYGMKLLFRHSISLIDLPEERRLYPVLCPYDCFYPDPDSPVFLTQNQPDLLKYAAKMSKHPERECVPR